MFESEFIDSFSRVPWYAVPTVYVPAIAAWAYWGHAAGASIGAQLAQFFAGWFVWSLMEYWLHRTLFHWTPKTSWGPKFHFILHGVHHEWYKDHLRLVMPPAASIAIGVVVWSALWLAGIATAPLASPSWIYTLFSGIMFGYLVYDMTHYYVHHGKPTSAWMKRLREHHAKHHHNPAFQERKFGVSSTLWDHVFRTY